MSGWPSRFRSPTATANRAGPAGIGAWARKPPSRLEQQRHDALSITRRDDVAMPVAVEVARPKVAIGTPADLDPHAGPAKPPAVEQERQTIFPGRRGSGRASRRRRRRTHRSCAGADCCAPSAAAGCGSEASAAIALQDRDVSGVVVGDREIRRPSRSVARGSRSGSPRQDNSREPGVPCPSLRNTATSLVPTLPTRRSSDRPVEVRRGGVDGRLSIEVQADRRAEGRAVVGNGGECGCGSQTRIVVFTRARCGTGRSPPPNGVGGLGGRTAGPRPHERVFSR